MAVTVATNGGTSGNNYYAEFNYAGNTYIVGHSGAAETAVGVNDVIVELTGLHTSALTVSTHNVLV